MSDKRERRRERRQLSGVHAYLVVISGKDGAIRSPKEKVKLKDISSSGASVLSSSVRPGGMHVMYNDLMLYKNSIELIMEGGGEIHVTVRGKVVWYDRPEGMTEYIIGLEFDEAVDLSPFIEDA